MGGKLASEIKSNPTVKSLIWLTVFLIFCNFIFTSGGWQRFFWGLFAYAGLALIYNYSPLNLSDIGLNNRHFKKGFLYGGVIVLTITLVLLIFYVLNQQAFRDPRYHQSLIKALFSSLILLPLRTVLFEEIAFRGMLLGLFYKLRNSKWFATILSSLMFGLWHIQSARLISSFDIGGGIELPKIIIILIVIIFTSAAGVFLTELRWRSKSLVAPILVHWFVNGFTTILAALSW